MLQPFCADWFCISAFSSVARFFFLKTLSGGWRNIFHTSCWTCTNDRLSNPFPDWNSTNLIYFFQRAKTYWTLGMFSFPYVAQRIFDLRQMKLNDVFQLILQSLGSLVCRKISRILFISPIFGNAQRIVNIPHTILWNGVDGIIICRSLDDYSVSFSDFRFLYSDLLTLACWRPIFLEELFRCVFQFSLHFRRCFHISLSFSAFS